MSDSIVILGERVGVSLDTCQTSELQATREFSVVALSTVSILLLHLLQYLDTSGRDLRRTMQLEAIEGVELDLVLTKSPESCDRCMCLFLFLLKRKSCKLKSWAGGPIGSWVTQCDGFRCIFIVYKFYLISADASHVVNHPYNYRHSGRVIKHTETVIEYRKSFGHLVKTELEVDEPQSYKEALRSNYAHFWMLDFKEEFIAQLATKSWVLVPPSEVPPGTKPIPHSLIGKFKPGYGDFPAMFKLRLTAVGCSERTGIGYGEQLAPVSRLESYRIFFSISTTEIWRWSRLISRQLALPLISTNPSRLLILKGLMNKGEKITFS